MVLCLPLPDHGQLAAHLRSFFVYRYESGAMNVTLSPVRIMTGNTHLQGPFACPTSPPPSHARCSALGEIQDKLRVYPVDGALRGGTEGAPLLVHDDYAGNIKRELPGLLHRLLPLHLRPGCFRYVGPRVEPIRL